MRVLKTTSVLVAMIFGLSVGSARAADQVWDQMGNQMYVKVPFSFLVDGQLMPAGQYTFTNLASGFVSIRGVGTHPLATITSTVTLGSEDPVGDVPAVVFLPYETHYLLIQVWLSRDAGFAPSRSVPYAQKLQRIEKLVLTTTTGQ